jgi:hypothetical protein
MKKLQVIRYNRYKFLFTFLPFILFAILPSASFAQKKESKKVSYSEDENKKAYFWIGFGPTVDWFAPTTHEFDLSRNKAKAGIIAGLNTDIAVTKDRFLYVSTGLLFRYLQGELLFVHLHDYRSLHIDSLIPRPTVRTYNTMYLTLPTGVKFRTNPSRGCVFSGKLGLYHSFKIGGKQFDNFYSDDLNPVYSLTTKTIPNKDASLFAESGYIGLGFEYVLSPKARVFANVDYSCQFNYFSKNAKNSVNDAQFKSIVHSLHIVFGVMF